MRTAVLTGCGQIKQKLEDPNTAREPLQLMEDALRKAAHDASAPGLLRSADAIWVLRGIWDYSNPAALLAERFGATGVETGLAPISGSSVQHLICAAVREIEAGKHDIVLIAGAEAEHSKRRTLRAGSQPVRTQQSGATADRDFGGTPVMVSREELEIGLGKPANVYSLFENALRRERGWSMEEHRTRVATLCSEMSRVAALNPNAWDQTARSADEIGTESESNRMVAYPYTKRMVANMVVDQAAAVIVCSDAAARRHGVPADRFVYPHVTVEITNSPKLFARYQFHDVPALGIAGRRALEMANLSIDDIPHIDFYSCFPSAVQIAIRELGVPENRIPTLTGGLSYGGGPFNSYVLHSTVSAMDKLRENPGSPALVTSLGGWFSKLGFAIYSTRPTELGYRHACLDDEVAQLPVREVIREVEARAVLETYALSYFEGQPHQVAAACLVDDERRVWATSEEPEVLAELIREEPCGRPVAVTRSGTFQLQ